MRDHAVLSVRDVSHCYSALAAGGPDIVALNKVAFEVPRNQFCSLVGKSGCGKTTLLRILAGLQVPTSGSVFMNGVMVESPQKELSVVFQDYNKSLIQSLTVLENVRLNILNLGLSKREQLDRAEFYLRLVGLVADAKSYPWQLSGGMQQRVAIARALSRQPSVLFLDEPFGALDAPTRFELEDQLLQIVKRFGVTVFMITHDIDEAIYMSDRVLVMAQKGILRGSNIDEPGNDDIHVGLGSERHQIETRGSARFSQVRRLVFEQMGLGRWVFPQAVET